MGQIKTGLGCFCAVGITWATLQGRREHQEKMHPLTACDGTPKQGVIADIIRIADVDVPTARKIRDLIDEEGLLDWSECTTNELRLAIADVM